jgi:hypothetical protein
MPTWTRALLIGVAGALLVCPAEVRAQGPDAHGPVSLERIRAGLDAPPSRLRVLPPSRDAVPTFRVEVHQYLSLEPLDQERFDPTYGLPSAGELMMGGIDKLRSTVAAFKKRRAQRRARQEVADSLAEFCAVHACPDPASK